MDKKEDGISVVVGFVIVLAIIAIIIAIWAVLGVPGQINEANYVHSFELENAFGDYQASLYSMYNLHRTAGVSEVFISGDSPSVHYAGMKNTVYSMLFPIGTVYNQGYLTLKKGVGKFEGNIIDVDGDGVGDEALSVDRLSVTLGNGSEIGFEGSGVFRRDGDSAHWIIYPMFDDLNRVIITNFDGSVSIGTNRDTALDTWYKSSVVPLIATSRYSASEEEWDAKLWREFFYEKLPAALPNSTLDGKSFDVVVSQNQIFCSTYGVRSVLNP